MFHENEKLLGKEHLKRMEAHTFLIVGAGGLGGHLANALVRLGAKRLILVDRDVFEKSNLNRQLFSNQKSVGEYKVDAVRRELLDISPDCEIECFYDDIESLENHPNIAKASVVFDAVDSVATRLWLEKFAERLEVPLFHGAIGGWYGEVALIEPGTRLLETLYGQKKKGVEKELGSPTFTPAIVANLMATECVKWLHDEEGVLRNKMLIIDLKHHSYQVVFDRSKK